jgi:hypothetical protein
VYSVPLLSPLVGRRLGFTSASYIVVSLQRGGLRQTFVENGRIRFSRLGQGDFRSASEVARAAAQESARIQQYLLNMRIVSRDTTPLNAYVLAPAADMATYRQSCADSPQLRFHIIDLDAATKRAGLRDAPPDALAERLFLHVLGAAAPSEQFADDAQRRFFQLWRARVGLVGAGAAALVLCTAFAGYRMLDVMSTRELVAQDRAQEARLQEQYARLQQRFPKTPASPENLKLLVSNYSVVQKQTTPLAAMLAEVSQALDKTPQLEIDRIQWRVGGDPRRSVPAKPTAPAAPSAVAAPATPAAPDASKAGADTSYQVIELSGRVNVAQTSDYRNITTAVNQFVEALRQRPGFEVFSAQLPFEIDAEKSLSGDIGVDRPTDVPRFTVIAARRLGS